MTGGNTDHYTTADMKSFLKIAVVLSMLSWAAGSVCNGWGPSPRLPPCRRVCRPLCRHRCVKSLLSQCASPAAQLYVSSRLRAAGQRRLLRPTLGDPRQPCMPTVHRGKTRSLLLPMSLQQPALSEGPSRLHAAGWRILHMAPHAPVQLHPARGNNLRGRELSPGLPRDRRKC